MTQHNNFKLLYTRAISNKIQEKKKKETKK